MPKNVYKFLSKIKFKGNLKEYFHGGENVVRIGIALKLLPECPSSRDIKYPF